MHNCSIWLKITVNILPPPELQLFPSHSGPPARLRNDDDQGEVLPNWWIRQTGWFKSTPSTRIWGGLRKWRKQTSPPPPAGRISRTKQNFATWTLSEGGSVHYPRGGGIFEPPEDYVCLEKPWRWYKSVSQSGWMCLGCGILSRIVIIYLSWLTCASQDGYLLWLPG